jgi:hypothetical protein
VAQRRQQLLTEKEIDMPMSMDDLRELLHTTDDDIITYARGMLSMRNVKPLYQMNPEALVPWLEALLSDEYTQATSRLHVKKSATGDEGYCCLGVLTKVAIEVANLDVDTRTVPYLATDNPGYDTAVMYDGVLSYLPRKVSEWAKLRYDPKIDEWRGLAGMNDNDVSFVDIAKLIWRLFGPDAPVRELAVVETSDDDVHLVSTDDGPQIELDLKAGGE